MSHIGSGLGSKAVKTFDLLDQFAAVLGSTQTHLWPFLESTGIDVQAYKEQDVPLQSGEAAAFVELDDPATGFAPLMHAGGVHSYHFEAGDDQHLVGANTGSLSYNGTTDIAMSIGCFFYIDSGTGTLLAKYDVAGTLREWKFDLAAGPDLRFTVYDESVDKEEGAQTVTALSTRRWYFGIGTYSGVGGNAGAVGDGTVIYVDGAAVTDTDIDAAGYADMEDGGSPLMIGATDDNAAPASEFTGRIALPFVCGKELSAANAVTLNGIGRTLLGL